MIKKMIRYILTFFYSFILKRKSVKIAYNIYFSKDTIFEGNNVINSNVNIINSSIGFGTYIGENCILPNLIIGSYCSLAQNIEVLPYTHPTTRYVSTHPSFFSILKQSGFTFVSKKSFEEELFFDRENGINAKIGNDVWIGANVKILGGLEIGDGSIIATGSIVTKNIPPYAIVGGVPAKVIRYRFNEEQIAYLLKLKWWEKDLTWLKNHSYLFCDIDELILKIDN